MEREKRVLESLAGKRWAELGPGVLLGRLDSGLILDAWVPFADMTDERPAELEDFLSPEAWRWLRQNRLTDNELESASAVNVPVVLCLPLGDNPHPELQCFWSERAPEGGSEG